MDKRLLGSAFIATGVFLGLVFGAGSAQAEPKLVWKADGFNGPESIVLDKDANVLYLSNVNGSPTDANGKGYISKLSPDGEIVEKEWVTGLNAPKGLALSGGKLYVADIDHVSVIDTKTGKILETLKAPGSTFLNDVTAHKDGRVFISDMLENHIWLLEDRELTLWAEGPELDHPNGLLAEDNRLVIGSWGKPKEDFSTDVPGTLLTIDLDSKEVKKLGEEPVGNLDGVEPDGKGGYYVTDWFNGGLYHFTADGKATLVMDMKQGSADHLSMDGGSLVVIPMMLDDEVLTYRIE